MIDVDALDINLDRLRRSLRQGNAERELRSGPSIGLAGETSTNKTPAGDKDDAALAMQGFWSRLLGRLRK